MIFNDDYGNLIDRRLRLDRALKFSIDNDETLCYFQPQYDFTGKRVVGFETLARWKSAEFGMVSPLQFIPMAEKSGFIKELSRFVIERTFAFAKSMQGRGLTVSFNASPMEAVRRILPTISSAGSITTALSRGAWRSKSRSPA